MEIIKQYKYVAQRSFIFILFYFPKDLLKLIMKKHSKMYMFLYCFNEIIYSL